MAREFGEPIRISRNGLEIHKNAFYQLFGPISDELKKKLDQAPIKADHIYEARRDCALTFLEEGILPTIRDSIYEPSTNEVIKIAEEFINRFKIEHPNDFDLENPIDLVDILEHYMFPLTTYYEIKSKHFPEDIQTFNLVRQANSLVIKVLHEQAPNFDED